MSSIEFVYFGTPIFVALALLINWQWRRGDVARRVNRGLRSYVSVTSLAPSMEADEVEDELSVA